MKVSHDLSSQLASIITTLPNRPHLNSLKAFVSIFGDESWQYVEGYAFSPTTLRVEEHAWLETLDGDIIDLTWLGDAAGLHYEGFAWYTYRECLTAINSGRHGRLIQLEVDEDTGEDVSTPEMMSACGRCARWALDNPHIFVRK